MIMKKWKNEEIEFLLIAIDKNIPQKTIMEILDKDEESVSDIKSKIEGISDKYIFIKYEGKIERVDRKEINKNIVEKYFEKTEITKNLTFLINFYKLLPEEFTSVKAIEVGEINKLSRRTVFRYLDFLVTMGELKKIKIGYYKKIGGEEKKDSQKSITIDKLKTIAKRYRLMNSIYEKKKLIKEISILWGLFKYKQTTN